MNIKPPPPIFLPLNRDPALAIEQAISILRHIIKKHPEVRRDFDSEAFIHHELAPALEALTITRPEELRTEELSKLTKPALVGNTRFGVGVSERMVVERAQREYEYQVTPEKEAERMKRVEAFRAELAWPVVTDAMVDRFLSWPLPKSVCSDLCVTSQEYPHPRCGTNLLTAVEARQMLEHVLVAFAPSPPLRSTPEPCSWADHRSSWPCQCGASVPLDCKQKNQQ